MSDNFVEHRYIKKSSIEYRAYQDNLAKQAISENCLIVLPTGLGKTTVALHVIAEFLSRGKLARAEQLTRDGKSDKAQWETDLANELRNRSTGLLARLNEVTSQRLAYEKAHGPAAPPALGALTEKKPLTPDEFAYVAGLDERLLKVRQELSFMEENARSLQLELQTNNTEEAVARIAGLLDGNNLRVRQSEREQADLELKKLEFRALRNK